MSGAYTRSAG